MAELAGAVTIALEQLAVEDDPGPDPATDPDHDQVGGSRATVEGQLGQGGSVTVVGHDDRHAVALLEERPEREVGPVEVDRPADDPRARVDDPRRADADAQEGRRIVGAQGVDKPEHELDRGVAVAPLEGQVDRAQDLASQVHDGTAEARLAEVEPDEVAAVRGHAQEDRRLAAARLPATDLLDQAVVHERADEVANGGARQAGDPCEVRARERAAIVQGAQDELLVEGSRLLVRRLLRQHRRAGAHPRVDSSDRCDRARRW